MAGPIKAKYVEKEHAVIDGVDVSGHWNRMFEQRTIFEYTPELIEKIADLPNAESFANCYQCAKCVAVCPVDVVGNYGPRKLYRYAQTGVDLTEAPELWLCTTCKNCLRVCPKEVDMIKIMPAAREEAILQGKFVPPELQQAFENTAKSGNPLGQPQRKRDAWIQNAGVEIPSSKIWGALWISSGMSARIRPTTRAVLTRLRRRRAFSPRSALTSPFSARKKKMMPTPSAWLVRRVSLR
jgi:heterodisulfide reductase subunit C